MEACELLAIEDRLDRIEAELASELPPHMRAFARAHASGSPVPPAPDVLQRAPTLATARAALVHPVLADRGLALVRLAAPLAIESDPAVRAARAVPATWTALAALAAARDAAAAARFSRRAIDVMHRLHGSAVDLAAAADARVVQAPGASNATSAPASHGGHRGARVKLRSSAASAERELRDEDGGPAGASSAASVSATIADPRPRGEPGLPPAVAGWFEPDGVVVDDTAIARVWDALRVRHGVDGAVRFEPAAKARPRTFVVEPGREVIVAIPVRIAAPADRFAVLHELGHAVAALALPAGLPRVVDEAIAAYIAGAVEREADSWYSPLATAARARRRALARALDQIERALPAIPEPEARPAEHPPAALWHDPGAQAAYVAAESIADALAESLDRALGPSPAPGALVAETRALCEAIDRASSIAL